MKVLLINGSPHGAGCTYTALEEVARALHHAAVPAPVQAGQVVLADVCGTGVAVVATKNIG